MYINVILPPCGRWDWGFPTTFGQCTGPLGAWHEAFGLGPFWGMPTDSVAWRDSIPMVLWVPHFYGEMVRKLVLMGFNGVLMGFDGESAGF